MYISLWVYGTYSGGSYSFKHEYVDMSFSPSYQAVILYSSLCYNISKLVELHKNDK